MNGSTNAQCAMHTLLGSAGSRSPAVQIGPTQPKVGIGQRALLVKVRLRSWTHVTGSAQHRLSLAALHLRTNCDNSCVTMMSCGIVTYGSVAAGLRGKHSASQAALLCCSAHTLSANFKLMTVSRRTVTFQPVASAPASSGRQQGTHYIWRPADP